MKVIRNSFRGRSFILLTALLCTLATVPLSAQQGHPLRGSWSGNRNVDGNSSRILLVLDLMRDQRITGYIIEAGGRLVLSDVTLDPATWTVRFQGRGQDRAGNPVSYQVEGEIINLGSNRERTINGTWQDGERSGNFQVVIN